MGYRYPSKQFWLALLHAPEVTQLVMSVEYEPPAAITGAGACKYPVNNPWKPAYPPNAGKPEASALKPTMIRPAWQPSSEMELMNAPLKDDVGALKIVHSVPAWCFVAMLSVSPAAITKSPDVVECTKDTEPPRFPVPSPVPPWKAIDPNTLVSPVPATPVCALA